MQQQGSERQFKRVWKLLAAVILVMALPVAAENIRRPAVFSAAKIQLSPTPHHQPITFNVQLAITPAQHAYGLMFSSPLAARTGMLFIFSKDGPRSFWMKDTPIRLDMLFFDSKGRLVSIIANAEPFSLTARKSLAAAQYVLEIGGGEAVRLGLGSLARLHLPLKRR